MVHLSSVHSASVFREEAVFDAFSPEEGVVSTINLVEGVMNAFTYGGVLFIHLPSWRV